jgi:hypothetical protein
MTYHNNRYFAAPWDVASVAKIGNTDEWEIFCCQASLCDLNMARPQVVGEDNVMDSVPADVFNNQSRTGKKMRPWNFVADLTSRHLEMPQKKISIFWDTTPCSPLKVN